MNRPISLLVSTLALAAPAAADPGDVLWHFRALGPLKRPTVAADGTIYWPALALHAIDPAGQSIWQIGERAETPVGLGANGTLYFGGTLANGFTPAIKAFSPAGQFLWDYSSLGQVVGFLGGPDVGPDGNVYAVAYGGTLPNPPGFGAFSLTPQGALRWHVDGFGNDSGTPSSEIEFGDGQLYKAEYNAPMPPGQLQSGLVAIDLQGNIRWQEVIPTQSSGPSRHPRVSPLNGNVHLMRPTRTIQTFRPDGSLAWVYTAGYTPTGLGVPAVDRDGSVYVINGSRDVISLDAAGNVRWIASNVVPYFAGPPEVSPDGSVLVFGTIACFGGACSGRVIALSTLDGSVVFDEALPVLPGGVPSVMGPPVFSNDGATVYVAADGAFSTAGEVFLFAIEVRPANGPIGTSYCGPAVANSSGAPATISAFGSELIAANALRLTASDLPAHANGYFIASPSQASVPNAGGSSGTLCIGLPSARFAAQIQNSGALGTFSIDVDLNAIPVNPPRPVMPGETWNFQAWFRDLPVTSNFTDGVSIRFL